MIKLYEYPPPPHTHTPYYPALELQPDDWLAVYYCGEMLGKQQKTDQATEHFVRAAQIET